MSTLQNKIDFALVLRVRNANPNGDPLNGNRPRTDYGGFGEISDVCLKRKLRDRLQESGHAIFVQSDDRKVDAETSLRNRAESETNGLGKEAWNPKKSKKDETAKKACDKWFDVRAFGQVFAFGKDGDMSAFAPKAHLGSAVIDWTPYYTKVVTDKLDGKWQTGNFWWGVKEGAIDLKKIADDVPQETKDKVEKARAGLKDGSFAVWTGPIKDNSGKEVLAAGTVADDAFLRGINFYVNGVDGKVPSGK